MAEPSCTVTEVSEWAVS